MAAFFIELTDPASIEPGRVVTGLPATIGRGHDCTVRIASDNKAVSRVHLELMAVPGGACLVNRASNPGTSRLDGRILALEEQVAVPANGELTLTVLDHEIRIGPAGTLALAVRDGESEPEIHPLDAATAVLLSPDRMTGRVARVTLADWAADPADEAPRLALFLDHGRPALARVGTAPGPLLGIDGGILKGRTAYLRPMETVSFGAIRCEIVEDGLAVETCRATGCGAINAAAKVLCRVCGAALRAAPPATVEPGVTEAVPAPSA